MDEFVVWLRAQLDEDDRIAEAACWDDQSDVWTARPPEASYERYAIVDYLGDGVVAVTPENADDDGVGQHVAEWDPARVRRETAAKRQVLKMADECAVQARSHDYLVNGPAKMSLVILKPVLLHLAAAYVGRPGYASAVAVLG